MIYLSRLSGAWVYVSQGFVTACSVLACAVRDAQSMFLTGRPAGAPLGRE